MLSNRQTEALNFIKHYYQKHHQSPTQREMQEALNISSFSFLNRILDKLEEFGFIERDHDKSRNNIQLLQSPYTIPLVGKIAAGSPIEAINHPEDVVITERILGDNRYLLEVKGDSMIEDNICDGDWVICERCQRVVNGAIVVALINRREATLKRYYYEKDRIRLEPANKNYKSQFYFPHEVIIQAKFVGLIRLNRK
ncbi:MAG: transcriptional repressor LexA [Gammaproteobacteria bacterium]|nr:transcriptional repressor LexA [Gammaproteobacteria bacterium]